jgi:hypothetical protein
MKKSIDCVRLLRRGIVLAILLLFSSCASVIEPVTTANSSLTQGSIEMYLHSGKTTKPEFLQRFGSPNVVTRDGEGREIWSYQRAMQASEKEGFSSFWTLLLFGQSQDHAGFKNSSTMITLIIKFNSHNIVEDFNSRTSCF